MSASIFEVVVRGHLGPELVLALESFTVEAGRRGTTRVVGPVTDQAQLLGVLEMFSDLNIKVVSVNPVEDETSPDVDDADTHGPS